MEMANLISLFLIFALVLISAFYQLSAIIWTAMIGAGLVILSASSLLTSITAIILWSLYLLVALFANLNTLRQRYILTPALKILQQQMPTISNTEREALDAGNTWWEKELFSGKPHWQTLFDIPKPTLTKEEQDFLDNQVEHLCSMLNDWQVVYEEKDLPVDVWNYLKQEKFFGLVIPKEFGGLGFSALAHSTVVMKIATRSISAAVNTMVPNSLGPAELLLHYGTDEQKAHYLPRLATGKEIPCFALTAPEAGSDAGSIPDKGIICRGQHEGKEVIGIRLNWDKRYITLAPIATVLGLAFQAYDPEHLIGDKENLGITLCLLPAAYPGVEIGSRHFPMQLAFMNGPTRGKDVFIPLDWIIGGEKMLGQGWRMLMECLSIGRSISLPALATAAGKGTYRFTGAYARLRRQFNTSISSFEGIEEALGNIAGYTFQLEASRVMTAGAVDLKVRPSIASAIAKYHMTEMSRTVISHAMDIHAGHMIQSGPRNILANVYAAMPISITVEGANILTRNLIIFGQGAIRCHPYLLKEVALITDPNPNIKELDQVLMSHIGFFVSNIIRNIAYGLTGGKFISSTIKNKRIRRYQKQLTRMSAALALMADTSLMLLGGSLKRRERISARLGDILSQLYLASSALKYYYDNNKQASDVDYVCWCLQNALQKMQAAFNELFANFPIKFVGKLMNWIIFPLGSAYQQPKDKLHRNIVKPMLEPNDFRDRLTEYVYISKKSDDITYRMEKSFAMVSVMEPLWKKLSQAVKSGVVSPRLNALERFTAAEKAGVISSEDRHMLSEFELLRAEVIKVNEFSFDLKQVIA